MINSSFQTHSNYMDRLHVGGIAPDSAEFMTHTAEEVQEVLGTLDASNRHLKDRSLQILSFTSCLSLFSGVIASIKGVREYQLGEKVEDLTTKLKGFFHFMAGSSEIVAGGAYIGMTGSMIDFYLKSSHVAHVVAEHLEHAGSGLIGFSTLFYSAYWGIELFDLVNCRDKIDALIKEGGDLKGVLQLIRGEVQAKNLHPKWHKALGKELLHDIMEHKSVELDQINNRINQKILLSMCYSLLSIGAAVVTTLVMSSFTFVAPWIFSAVGAGLGIIWLLNDVYNLKECFKEEVMSWEKGWIYFSTLFCLAAVMGSICASQELLSYALTLTLGLAIFIVHYCAIRKIHSNETAHA